MSLINHLIRHKNPIKDLSTFQKRRLKFETTLPMTCRILLANNLNNSLYIIPTNDMRQKSISHWGLSTLGIRDVKVLFQPFVIIPFRWKLVINCIMLSLISAHNFLIKPKLIPFGLRLLKLSPSHIADFYSSKQNGLIKSTPSKGDNVWKWRLSAQGLSTSGALKWAEESGKTVLHTLLTLSSCVKSRFLNNNVLVLLLYNISIIIVISNWLSRIINSIIHNYWIIGSEEVDGLTSWLNNERK